VNFADTLQCGNHGVVAFIRTDNSAAKEKGETGPKDSSHVSAPFNVKHVPAALRIIKTKRAGGRTDELPTCYAPKDEPTRLNSFRLGARIFGVNDVTRLLSAVDQGDAKAADQLLPLVYDELRRLAAYRLTQEKPGQTLQPTALVHEAYVRLVAGARGDSGATDDEPHWQGRGHFFAAAAEAMRRILVENARRKKRHKHGGDLKRVELADQPGTPEDDRLLELDDALGRLAREDPVAARVVELRHFAGLGHEAIAAALGISVYQARQKWTYARAWLSEALGPS
jgi:RNA polymerase sigma factor (TIGR02999 family)